MNKLLDLGNRFAAKSDWTDFALTKFCLASMGVLIGISIPLKKKKEAALIAAGIFTATYIPLMLKVYQTAKDMKDEENA